MATVTLGFSRRARKERRAPGESIERGCGDTKPLLFVSREATYRSIVGRSTGRDTREYIGTECGVNRSACTCRAEGKCRKQTLRLPTNRVSFFFSIVSRTRDELAGVKSPRGRWQDAESRRYNNHRTNRKIDELKIERVDAAHFFPLVRARGFSSRVLTRIVASRE